jgi:hypothetical protein
VTPVAICPRNIQATLKCNKRLVMTAKPISTRRRLKMRGKDRFEGDELRVAIESGDKPYE